MTLPQPSRASVPVHGGGPDPRSPLSDGRRLAWPGSVTTNALHLHDSRSPALFSAYAGGVREEVREDLGGVLGSVVAVAVVAFGRGRRRRGRGGRGIVVAQGADADLLAYRARVDAVVIAVVVVVPVRAVRAWRRRAALANTGWCVVFAVGVRYGSNHTQTYLDPP